MIREIDKTQAKIPQSGKGAAKVPQTAWHVLQALALHADGSGGSCYPSLGRLAAETGMNERSIRRILETSLSELVEVTRGRQHATNRYRLRVDRLSTLPRIQTGSSVQSETGQDAQPEDDQSGSSVHSEAVQSGSSVRSGQSGHGVQSEKSRPDRRSLQSGSSVTPDRTQDPPKNQEEPEKNHPAPTLVQDKTNGATGEPEHAGDPGISKSERPEKRNGILGPPLLGDDLTQAEVERRRADQLRRAAERVAEWEANGGKS